MELLKAVFFESTDKITEILSRYENLSEEQQSEYYVLLNKALEIGKIDVAKLLLDKRCKVNDDTDPAKESDTPLHYAVKLNNEELVEKLLKSGASITRINSNLDTPLHLAFLYNNKPIIKALMKAIKVTSADDNKKNRDGLSHLHIVSTRTNSAEIIKSYVNFNKEDIVQSVSLSAPRWKGYTALHFAAKFGSFNSMEALLSFKVNNLIPVKEVKGKKTLDLVKKQLQNLQNMSDLLGNEVNQSTPNSKLPLHSAVKMGQKICVEMMLRDNVDLETIEEHTSSTPLHLALYRDNPGEKNSIVEILFNSLKERSINNGNPLINKKDDIGASYLHIAVTRDDTETVNEFLNNVPDDVNSEIRLNSQGFSNFAPLHFATMYRHPKMVELLIDRGARVDQLCADGTALHIACELGEHEIIEILLINQADVNVARSSDGKTPLHLLVCHFVDDCSAGKINEDTLKYIEELIIVGARVNAKDKLQRTALFQRPKGLLFDGFWRCMVILLAEGADVNLGKFEIQNNNSEELPLNNCFVLYEHLMKLKTLKLKVNQMNRQMVKEIFVGRSNIDKNQLATWENELRSEVDSMKNEILGEKLSLYNFMCLDPKRAACHTKNPNLINIKNNLNESYPRYAVLIKLQYRKAMNAVIFERSS